MSESKAADEGQIRRLIEERVQAVHAKDAGLIMSNYAPDVAAFDVVNPLRYAGRERVRQRAEEWLASFAGPIGYEVRDLDVAVGDDVAYCHYLFRVSGTLQSGGQVGMWVRATACYRKRDDVWLVMHEHNSVPFNPETGQASLDLEP